MQIQTSRKTPHAHHYNLQVSQYHHHLALTHHLPISLATSPHAPLHLILLIKSTIIIVSTSYFHTPSTKRNKVTLFLDPPMAYTQPTNGAGVEKNGIPPGKPMSIGTHMLDKGAKMLQSLKPIKQMSQHACTFALYSQDMSRQIETHHYITRINQDFLQCAVYDSDDSSGRLIGVEYIVSDRIFDTLPPDEQKLWHSHAYEVCDHYVMIMIMSIYSNKIKIVSFSYYMKYEDTIRASSAPTNPRNGCQTGARKHGQNLWEVLVHVANR